MKSWDVLNLYVIICLCNLLSSILIRFNSRQFKMLIPNLFTIVQLVLSIEYAYSFKRFKQYRFTYYKAPDSIYFKAHEDYRNFTYFYVAGETRDIEIHKSLVNSSDLFNWKVVNDRKDRLMFVHKNKPKMLVDREFIRDVNYAGKLSGTIIALGDNQALHVPTIFNPNLTKQFPVWNYIELLYFNVASNSIKVIRSLPWLKNDDWKFILEWKMMDYIHFDDKLYLLIKRSIRNEKTSNGTQEISIIRLCLDKGSELISSAIEIRYNRPEFQTNQITAAIFIYLTYAEPEKFLLLITKQASNKSLIHTRYFIDDFVSLFDKAGQECASGAYNYTLMRYHLRSEVRSCQKTTYKDCSSNKNTLPSVELNFDRILDYHFIFAYGESTNPSIEDAYDHTLNETHFCHQTNGSAQICIKIHKNFNYDNSIQNVEVYFSGYPLKGLYLFYNSLRRNESRDCLQFNGSYFTCFKDDRTSIEDFPDSDDLQLHRYFNHRPLGYFQITKDTNQIFLKVYDYCPEYKSCIQCLMYGVSTDCIWSNSVCSKKINAIMQTVDYCFKVTRITPLIFNYSSPQTLTIELDKQLELVDSQEYLDIRAGPLNHCTNITINNVTIKCSLRSSRSGKFKISVSIRNDRYADTTTVGAQSNEKVYVIGPEFNYLLIIILLLSSLTLTSWLVYARFIKRQSKKPKKVSKARVKKFPDVEKKRGFAEAVTVITRVISQIISSTLKTAEVSSVQKAPSSKLVKSRSSMPSVSKQLYLPKSQNSSLSSKNSVNQQSTKMTVKSIKSKTSVAMKSSPATAKSKSKISVSSHPVKSMKSKTSVAMKSSPKIAIIDSKSVKSKMSVAMKSSPATAKSKSKIGVSNHPVKSMKSKTSVAMKISSKSTKIALKSVKSKTLSVAMKISPATAKSKSKISVSSQPKTSS